MKKMILTLLLCIGSAVFAETNLNFDVPRGMIKTWNLTNFESGLIFDLYESRDENLEGEFVIVAGQIPICACIGTEIEEIVSLVMGNLQEVFPLGKIESDFGFAFSVDATALYDEDDIFARRIQFYIDPNDIEGSGILDAHLLIKDEIFYLIATGMSGESNLDTLENLTQFVLGSLTMTR